MQFITRKLRKTIYKICYYDPETRKMHDTKITLHGYASPKAAGKMFHVKHGEGYKILEIEKLEEAEKKYTIPIETFVKYAKEIEQVNEK